MSRQSLLRAGVLWFAGIAFSALATFTLTGVVSNMLGARGTGLFFQAIAIFAVASSALQLGADTALVRALSRHAALGERAWIRPTVWIAVTPVLVLSAVFAAVVWLAATPLAAAVAPGQSGMADTIRVLAPFAGAGAVLAVLLGGTRGLGSPHIYTLVQNVALPLARLVIVGAAVLGGLSIPWLAGLWAAPLAVLAAAAAAILALQVRRETRSSSEAPTAEAPPLGEVARIWSFALPRGAAACIERALDWGGVLIVIALLGPVQGGIYAIVNRCASVGYMLDQAVRIVTGPQISRALALGARATAEELFLSVTRALILISWPFYLTLAVFAPVVLSFFGSEFRSGALPLTLVALALMLATTAGMVQSVLLMGGKSSWQLLNRLAQLLTLVVVTLALVPSLGLVGAALGWVAAIVVDTTLATLQVAGRMRLHTSPRAVALPAVLPLIVFGGGGVLAALLFGQSTATLLWALCVLGAAYVVIAFLARRQLHLPSLRPANPAGVPRPLVAVEGKGIG